MKKVRFAVFGLILAGSVAFAVSTLVAQSASRERLMLFGGQARQLGVTIDDLTPEELKTAAGAPSGVRIEDIRGGSPAEKAGLKEGDIVVEVDGDQVRSARQFARLIQETPDGRSIKLAVVRDGKRQSIEMTPEPARFGVDPDGERLAREMARSFRDIEPRMRELEPRLRDLEPRLREFAPRLREFRFDAPFDFDFDMRRMSPRARLGIRLDDLTPQLAEYFGAKDGGVLVSSVTSDSVGAKAGLKVGDVITSINGDRVRDSGDLFDELRDKSGEVTIGLVRDRKEMTLKATLQAERGMSF